MTYLLSLLDKSPIPEAASAQQALAHTVKLAQRAEQLGYHRYWVAEHHGSKVYAGPAPEILVAHILAKTSRIRVGSGGVMLQHYSPYKVAEVFRLLEALAPGRVDLGVGKAPGGMPLTTRALQALHDPDRKPAFDAQLAQLDAFLHGFVPDGHPLAGAVATPQPGQLPQRWLLGGSPQSAALAARLGWDFVYAGHFNGDADNIEASIAAYRKATGRPPALALFALATQTQEQAEKLVQGLRIYKLHLPTGQSFNLPSLEGAVEFARQTGVTDFRTEEQRPYVIAGTADHVRAELDALHQRWGIREFVIDTPVAGFAERLASIELLAAAHKTAQALAA
ncbi:LLM class flavin-dependent oxidoreductase [uncultured Ramlibacter sp.]|uniref:LLM class flavin-dependent oxidoreductase n=1 Tax=uncultured Ramlibacter sp. TaxID=260755 RepID=UPI0026173F03|nr:LLM class flavin-dependent oxidoreductase [uncultured Ramlibacter sp.]